MKLNGLQTFVESLLSGKGRGTRRGAMRRGNRRRVGRGVEACEQRVLLTVNLNLLHDNDVTAPLGTFQTLVADTGRIYFVSQDGTHGNEVWTSDGTAGGTHLVKDVAPGLASSNPFLATTKNEDLYFVANDKVHGAQLWKTDGTEGGTVMLSNIPRSSLYGVGHFDEYAWVGNTLYFAAQDSTHGMELWKTDGTTVGTSLVSDIAPGTEGSYPYNLINVSGTLYFTAGDDNNGSVLYRIDNGTGLPVLIKNIYPGDLVSDTAYGQPSDMTVANGKLFFVSNDGVHGLELWTSDGTTAGTKIVKDINPSGDGVLPSDDRSRLTAFGTGVAFAADDGVHGRELWVSDGTDAGTKMVKNITPDNLPPGGPEIYNVHFLRNMNGTLYFMADDGVHGSELWTSDGSGSGTNMVLDLAPGAASSSPHQFAQAGSTVYFYAGDAGHGVELWKTDGTAGGTSLVKDILPGIESSILANLDLTVVGSKVAFSARDATHGTEVWVSDGTSGGTILLKDVNPGDGNSSPYNIFSANGSLYFLGYTTGIGTQLWKSNLTPAGTSSLGVVDVRTDGNNGSQGVVVGDTFYYTALGKQLWKSDGTPGGTVLVKDFFPAVEEQIDGLLSIRGLVAAEGNLFGADVFLIVGDAAHGEELWKSDGTAGGTTLVKDIRAGSEGSYPTLLTSVDGVLYFFADDGVHGTELWVSDGTPAGTTFVKDINSGNGSSLPGSSVTATIYNGALYFAADDGVHGTELWTSDGTGAGTTLVQEFAAGSAGATIGPGVVLNGAMYLSVDDGVHGWDMWRYNGTSGGATLVKDIAPGSSTSQSGAYTLFNGKILFAAGDASHGVNLWMSDGTAGGTVLVKDFGDNPGNGIAGPIVISNNLAYFVVRDAVHGFELWRSDGTTAGTWLVKETIVGPKSSSPSALADINGVLYFWAKNATDTRLYDLWKSDGTAIGTVIVNDWNGAPEHYVSSQPGTLININGTIFLKLDDSIHGQEWWSMRLLAESAGTFRNGTFYLDANNSNGWNKGTSGGGSFTSNLTGGSVTDQQFAFGIAGDIPVSGDWNADDTQEVGVFRNGVWFLDQNGNYKWNGTAGGDVTFSFGIAGDIPITGDWNGDGTTDVGVVRNGAWYLDMNGNHKWDSATDAYFKFGNPGDKPVTGDWNGDGTTKVGVFRGATWYLDVDGNRKWNAGDVAFNFGTAGDTPVTGDWNGDQKTDVGVFRSGYYYVDKDGNRKWSAGDVKFGFGNAADVPVSGTWNLNIPSAAPPAAAPASLVVKSPESAVAENTAVPEVKKVQVRQHVKKHAHKGKA